MLICARSIDDLEFDALMEVYIEGNVENAAYFYPEISAERGLSLVIDDFRKFLCEDFFHRDNAQYWILAENGQYISALRFEKHRGGLLLEALETRPDRRGQGYAKHLIQAVLEKLASQTPIYSHVTKWNAASLATHRACGFEQLSDYVVASDGRIDHDEITFTITT